MLVVKPCSSSAPPRFSTIEGAASAPEPAHALAENGGGARQGHQGAAGRGGAAAEALESTARRGLTAVEVTTLVDTCVDLTRDANFRVAQGGLQALAAAAVLAGEHFKIHLNALVPAAVERLGDGKQPVREAARQLLVTLKEISSPTIIVERAGNYAWAHKSWRVREEFVLTVSTAVGLFASTELLMQRVLLSPVLQLMNDSNQSVREAAISCIEVM